MRTVGPQAQTTKVAAGTAGELRTIYKGPWHLQTPPQAPLAQQAFQQVEGGRVLYVHCPPRPAWLNLFVPLRGKSGCAVFLGEAQ